MISGGFQGLDGQSIPEMTDDVIESISARYIELFQNFTGEKFEKGDYSNIKERIFENITKLL